MKNALPVGILVFCFMLLFTSGVTLGEGEPVAHITKKDPSSATASDGSITINATGGVPPYRIIVISSNYPYSEYNQATITLDGLKAGAFQFTIQDSTGKYTTKIVELQ